MNFLRKNILYFKTKGHTGYKIQNETGLSQSTLSSFINSEKENITLKTLECLKIYFTKYENISLDDLIFKDLSKED